MKLFLFFLALLFPLGAFGQPILKNYYTTNSNPASSSSVVNNTYSTNTFTTNLYTQTITSTTNIYNIGKGGQLTVNEVISTNFVRFPWTTLAYSGSNVTVNVTNSMFKLLLTNAMTFFTAPTSLPGTNLAQTIQIALIQDGTGTRQVMLTNSAWIVSGSGASTNAIPTINTNANGVTILTFVSSPFSATLLYGVPTAFTP